MIHTKLKGFDMRFDIENPHIEDGMRKTGKPYEDVMLEFIADNFRGGTFLDIGAYVGTHSVFFAKGCADKVIAFEPNYDAYHKLVTNIYENNVEEKVATYNIGLGKMQEKRGIRIPDGDNDASARLVGIGETLIQPLDEVLRDYEKQVTLIKIDVEGMELEVVKGAFKTLKKHRPALFIECPVHYIALDHLLEPFGYRRLKKFNATPTYYYACTRY